MTHGRGVRSSLHSVKWHTENSLAARQVSSVLNGCPFSLITEGYDFDSRWDEGLANRREKIIMDMLTERDSDGEMIFTDKEILTTDLKKLCGFGKGGEKNFPGITTKLMMQTYLTIVDFHRRKNKKGGEYGMPVSVMLPPEAVWGYEHITSRYSEDPKESWEALIGHTQVLFPQADEADIIGIIGKAP